MKLKGKSALITGAAALRSLLEPHAEKLVEKLVALANSGDTTALRICIDRLIPPLKSHDMPIAIEALTGSLVDQGNVVLRELSAGRVTPDQAATLIQTVAAQARIIEVDELEKRISQLEAARVQ